MARDEADAIYRHHPIDSNPGLIRHVWYQAVLSGEPDPFDLRSRLPTMIQLALDF